MTDRNTSRPDQLAEHAQALAHDVLERWEQAPMRRRGILWPPLVEAAIELSAAAGHDLERLARLEQSMTPGHWNVVPLPGCDLDVMAATIVVCAHGYALMQAAA